MPVVRFIFAANQTTVVWVPWISTLVAIREALSATFCCSVVVQKMLDIEIFATYTPSEQQLNNGVWPWKKDLTQRSAARKGEVPGP